MKRYRVYLDTSAIGGCCDEEFEDDSRRVIELARAGRLTLLLSDVVIAELAGAPAEVQEVLPSVPPENVETVPISAEINALRDAYLAAGIVGPRWTDDATHVAAATVARADAIASWNFKHIVRLDKIKAYNQVNLANGYGILTIVSPKEVLIDEPD
jgi:predicted nucleic acid-binding protein